MERKFQVRLKGSFYSIDLIDPVKRDYIYTLEESVNVANIDYGDRWAEIFNGIEGVNCEDLGQ